MNSLVLNFDMRLAKKLFNREILSNEWPMWLQFVIFITGHRFRLLVHYSSTSHTYTHTLTHTNTHTHTPKHTHTHSSTHKNTHTNLDWF